MTQLVTLKLTTTSLGAADTEICPAAGPGGRKFLMVANTHATQTIDVALAGGVAATGNGTSVRIAALGYLRFDTEAIPQNAIRAIASGAATPVAVWEG